MKRAIIDIGTNTAHLLIGQIKDGKLQQTIYRRRYYTFLGENGLDLICKEALSRLWHALDNFEQSIADYHVSCVMVIATEGLRSAQNGDEIFRSIRSRYSWNMKIISGDQEAELIFEGVRQAFQMNQNQHYLIMDIGGGSVEFIFVKAGVNVFIQSFPIGISRLYNSFHQNDPCTEKDIVQMEEYLDEVLQHMWRRFEDLTSIKLIGCAGTFEIFLETGVKEDPTISICTVSSKKLADLLSKVMGQTLDQRNLVEGLPPARVKYIVVALALIEYVVKRLQAKEFLVSKYALKEGAIVTNSYF